MFQNICKVRGWKKGDPQYEKTKTVLNNVWIGLQAKADADNDQQMERIELVSKTVYFIWYKND
ncbi:Non-specific lipid-transfer protein [Homalodisca vitripennis]|nr:Non-specific lipid-transfer protein [Homalodisca vitripennis]